MTRAHKSRRRAASTARTARATDAELSSKRERAPLALLALVAVSVVLLGVRLYAASVVGFGDGEALYATWAAHAQPAYLDHPGLVGMVARAIGGGAIPMPTRAHVITAFAATLVPWLAYAAARALGAIVERAAQAALCFAVTPEIAIGLFALTPDLLLATTWLAALGLAGVGLRAPPGSNRSVSALLGAGLAAGVACAAKVSGVLLVISLVAAYASIAITSAGHGAVERTNARRPWPWAGLLAGLVIATPIALYEAKTGFPMLHHRFIDTQTGAGLALRNVGALVGGQLAYLSPLIAIVAVLVAIDLVRERSRDPISRLLWLAFALPVLPLVVLCLWSPVSEPHWLAPALLPLPLHAARRAPALRGLLGSRRFFLAALASATALTVAVHAWVLIPESARLRPDDTDAKIDIASELFGWPTALAAVEEQLKGIATPFDPESHGAVVVGPHWTICAQIHAGLPGVRVGCATPIQDDFDRWLPREQWRRAERVVFVTDNRFPGDGAAQLPNHVQTGRSRVRILRGGRTARVFELYLYDRRASSSL